MLILRIYHRHLSVPILLRLDFGRPNWPLYRTVQIADTRQMYKPGMSYYQRNRCSLLCLFRFPLLLFKLIFLIQNLLSLFQKRGALCFVCDFFTLLTSLIGRPRVKSCFSSVKHKKGSEVSPRSGFFHHFKPNEVVVRRWSEKEGNVLPADALTNENLQLQENLKSLGTGY